MSLNILEQFLRILELPETFVQTTLGDVADSKIVEIDGCNSRAYAPFGYFSWYLHKRIQSVGFSLMSDVKLTGFVPKVRSWKIMRRQTEKTANQIQQEKLISANFLFF